MENDLRAAPDSGGLAVHYQPQIDVASGKIVGAEALMRWTRPGHGAVSPAGFIPVAEATGQVVSVGAFDTGTIISNAGQQLLFATGSGEHIGSGGSQLIESGASATDVLPGFPVRVRVLPEQLSVRPKPLPEPAKLLLAVPLVRGTLTTGALLVDSPT